MFTLAPAIHHFNYETEVIVAIDVADDMAAGVLS